MSKNKSSKSKDNTEPRQREKKVSDEMFLAALKQSRGLYAETSRFIEEVYGISYSRQSIRFRVERHFKEAVQEIREANVDKAENTVMDLMGPEADDRVRLQAATFYLRKQGKERGYADGINLDVNEKIEVHVSEEKPPHWITDK